MSRSESLAAYLRAQARRCLDRVESDDGGRNARRALSLLDAAAHARGRAVLTLRGRLLADALVLDLA